MLYFKNIVLFSIIIVLIFTNSEDTDEMHNYAAFHLKYSIMLHLIWVFTVCKLTYLVVSRIGVPRIQRVKIGLLKSRWGLPILLIMS